MVIVKVEYSRLAELYYFSIDLLDELGKIGARELNKYFSENFKDVVFSRDCELSPGNFRVNLLEFLNIESLEEYGFTAEEVEEAVLKTSRKEIGDIVTARQALEGVNPDAFKKLKNEYIVFGWLNGFEWEWGTLGVMSRKAVENFRANSAFEKITPNEAEDDKLGGDFIHAKVTYLEWAELFYEFPPFVVGDLYDSTRRGIDRHLEKILGNTVFLVDQEHDFSPKNFVENHLKFLSEQDLIGYGFTEEEVEKAFVETLRHDYINDCEVSSVHDFLKEANSEVLKKIESEYVVFGWRSGKFLAVMSK